MKRSEGQPQEVERIRRKVRRITFLLEKRLGIPRNRDREDPLDVLILTVLSQNTNDRNRDQAYESLRAGFPRWEDVLQARPQSVSAAIRVGGLANQKAARIREILRWVKEEYGSLTLLPLRKMDSAEIERTLGHLKGIGPKTLNCLLLFGLRREAFPVDTHVLRVGKRLGIIPKEMNAEEAHAWMKPLVPDGKALSLHVNLIQHGRLVCKAQNPRCSDCYLADQCDDLAARKRTA